MTRRTEGLGDDVRTRRMAESFRQDLPSDDEIRRGRRRFDRRGAVVRKLSPKLLFALVVQGFALGLVTLAAASWVAIRVLPARERPPSVPAASEPAGGSDQGARTHGTHALAGQLEGTALAPPRAAFADVANEAASHAVAPAAERAAGNREGTKVDPAAGFANGGPAAMAESRSAIAALPLLPADDSDTTDGRDGSWSRVAKALATSDWTAADRALGELVAKADPATRDAAELARAQLFIAHGQGERFRGTVERLARSGQTPLIRRRAAGLLEQLR